MQGIFERILRKIRRNTAVQGGLIGAAVGMAVVSVWIAICKWQSLELLLLWCIPTAVAAALAAGFGYYLLRAPSARRLASSLDARCGMNERLATMVDFRGEDGEMVELQRADAAARLAAVPEGKLKYGRLWACIASAVLGGAMLLGAVLLPAKAEDPPDLPPVDTDVFALSEWQRLALEDLIAEVRASDMEAEPREAVALELEKLLSVLESTTTRTGMVKAIGSTAVAMDGIAEDANSLEEIKAVLRASQKAAVSLTGETLGKVNDPIVEQQLELLEAELEQARLQGALGEYSVSLGIALVASGISADDPLYAAIRGFGASLSAAESEGAVAAATLTNALQELLDGIHLALSQQATNRGTVDYAVNRLLKIFGMSASELPDEFRNSGNNGVAGDYEEKEDENIGGGGLGDGEVDYGSNDKIYDPVSGAHVAYGSVLNGYLGKVEGKRQDGLLPDGAEDGINRYFDILYGDTQKDEE